MAAATSGDANGSIAGYSSDYSFSRLLAAVQSRLDAGSDARAQPKRLREGVRPSWSKRRGNHRLTRRPARTPNGKVNWHAKQVSRLLAA